MVYMAMVGPTADSWTVGSPAYVVRSPLADDIAPEIRALMREFVPESPMYRVFTMEALAQRSMAQLSFTMLMLAIASGLALILGAVGLYGVLSYVVSTRNREIAVRMALGAQNRTVRRMVVLQGARITALGVATGFVAALFLMRVLDSLLFRRGGARPADVRRDVGRHAGGRAGCQLPTGAACVVRGSDGVAARRVATPGSGGRFFMHIRTGMSLHRARCLAGPRRPGQTTGPRTLLLAALAAAAASFACNPGAGEARELDAACAEGDAAACNQLGYRVRQGQYVLADWRRAADLFRQACDGGEPEGCVRLARMHVHRAAQRRGVALDSAVAETLFQQGCDGEALVGCTDLAGLYVGRTVADTTGATDLYGRAAGLYERACEGGEMTGCTRLGALYGEGRGVAGDPDRAADLHRRACDGGTQLGCAHLGQSYESGQGVERDAVRAAALYEQACETEMTGCFRLAGLYTRGVGVAQDYERAAELFDDACDGTMRRDVGSPPVAESCFRLADMIVNGTVDRPLWRASRYFRSACSLGHDEACGRS